MVNLPPKAIPLQKVLQQVGYYKVQQAVEDLQTKASQLQQLQKMKSAYDKQQLAQTLDENKANFQSLAVQAHPLDNTIRFQSLVTDILNQSIERLALYLQDSVQDVSRGKTLSAFQIHTASLPYGIGQQLASIDDSWRRRIATALEDVVASMPKFVNNQDLFKKLKQAGLQIGIIPDGVSEAPFEPSLELAEFGGKFVQALYDVQRTIEFTEQPKMVNGMWPSEKYRIYPGPAWKSFTAAIEKKGDANFYVDFRDLPAEIGKDFLKFADDPKALLWLTVKVLAEIGQVWLQQNPDRIKKALDNGWRLAAKR